ncbi:MAG: ATP-binding protein [Patescibacteria group bacterium]
MQIISNLDLMAVGLTSIAIGIIGWVVYVNDRRNFYNKSFFVFAVLTIAYAVTNYFSYRISSDKAANWLENNLQLGFSETGLVLWLLRLTLFFATWHAMSIFTFLFSISRGIKFFPAWYKWLLTPAVSIVALLTLTPYVFTRIDTLAPAGEVTNPERGWGMPLFFGTVTILTLSGIAVLVRKFIKVKEQRESDQLRIILVGISITIPLVIIFNVILPVSFDYLNYIPLVPTFFFPFILLTGYAILRHGLFNVKVIATELLIFTLWIFLFLRALLSSTLEERVINGALFVLTLIVGVFLIRSVFKEVSQRERIEGLLGELGKSNDKLWVANEKLKELDRQKSEFVSIASHQLRSPLTAIKGYSSMLLEGSFGKITDKVEEAISRIFQSSQKLVIVIEDFLNISRIELVTMKYEMTNIDLKQIVETIIRDMWATVERNNLKLNFVAEDGEWLVIGDSGKLSQVVSNLIDNALKYTHRGSINVSLAHIATAVRLTVADTGIGIASETMPKLFNKFSRASDAGKTNIVGTGLGLYVAKQIVEAHRGKIWAESEGVGHGSRFILELVAAIDTKSAPQT